MTLKRARILLLSLALSSPAAAQVRAIPGEALTAPLAAPSAGTPASFATPALSAPALSASLNEIPIVAEPSAPAAETRPNAAAAAPSFARAGSASLVAPAAGRTGSGVNPLPSVSAISAATQREPHDGTTAGPSRSPAVAGTSAETIAAAAAMPLDELFDGRAALGTLAVAPAAPEDGSEKGSALPPPPRVRGRAEKIADIAVPAAVGGIVALGLASPHLGLAVMQGLGQAAYWLANPLAFMFTVPQIYRILLHRSAEVSKVMTLIGLISAFVTALSFAFDGKTLMMYRNLAQTAGFAGMLGLEMKYGRAKGLKASSRKRAMLETGAFALAFGALMLVAGRFLMAAVPAVALMSSLLIPFQILSGFGFTYMMYAQLRKMYLDHSAGDASSGMMWAYLGTKVIWIWSLATMLSFVAGPAWLVLAAGALFSGVSWLATRYALTHLIHAPWTFLPEKIVVLGRTLTRRVMGDSIAFLALAALILALSGVGHLAFATLLGIKAGAVPLFGMYLLYTVQNLVAAMATSKTLRLQGRLGRKAPQPRP